VSIRGAGAGSRLNKPIDLYPTFLVKAQNVTIDNIHFAGPSLDVTGYPGAEFGNSNTVFNYHTGIAASLDAHGLTVRNCKGTKIAKVLGVDPFFDVAAVATRLKNLTFQNIEIDQAWCAFHGGQLDNPTITDIRGTYARFIGTPSSGDVGPPAHVVYLRSEDTAIPTLGGIIDGVQSSPDTDPVGSPLKMKQATGMVIRGVVAHGTYGIAEFQDLTNCQIIAPTSTEDNYPDAGVDYGFGALWLVDCARTKVIDAFISFASGTHGHGIFLSSGCTDIELIRPHIVANRSTSAVAATRCGIITSSSVRTIIDNPVVESIGATLYRGISVSGADTKVLYPKVTGDIQTLIYADTVPTFLDWDPVLNLPSRQNNGLTTSFGSGATTSIVRDRSVGQTTPTGITDSFDRADASGIGYTDDRKPWVRWGIGGQFFGGWGIISNACRYTDSNSRALIIADAGLADGTLTVVVGAIGAGQAGLIVRGTDADNYVGVNLYIGAGDVRCQLVKRIAGANTSVNLSASPQVAAGDTVAVVCSGTSVSVKVNGTQVIAPQTITEFSTITRHGLWATAAGTGWRFNSLVFA
jgi:hypothetical protein